MGEASYPKKSVLLGLILLGLVLSSLVAFPTYILSFPAFGSPLAFHISSSWLMGGALLLLAAAGSYSLARSQPGGQEESPLHTATYAVLPSVVTLVAFLSLRILEDRLFFTMGLALAGLLLATVLAGQYHSGKGWSRVFTRWTLDLVAYGGAAFLYTTLYGLKARSLLSATGVSLLSAALALEILRGSGEVVQIWLYASVTGLVLGELTWVLNYWGTGAQAGGSVILLIFYLITALARQCLTRRLERRLIFEFLLLALLGMALLGWLFSWTW